MGEEGVGSRDGLGVDVSAEGVLLPQQTQGLNHQLGGFVRAAPHGGGQEQSLNIVAPVEADGELAQLTGGEGGAAHVVGPAVDAVLAVVDAAVGEQHLQQGDAPPVSGEGVAAARGHGGAHGPRTARPIQPAGGAGGVIFCRVGEYGQFIHQLHGTTLRKHRNVCTNIMALEQMFVKHRNVFSPQESQFRRSLGNCATNFTNSPPFLPELKAL